jgi:hypothetical protein
MPKTNEIVPVYPTLDAYLCIGEDSLTEITAKKLLGWTVSSEEDPLTPENVHIRDMEGNKVHCSFITQYQRRYYLSSVKDLMWAILSGKWEFNGEGIIIGQQGFVLDGKHRLAALIFAVQEWNRNPERYPYWKEWPTLDTLVLYGVKESNNVVNTIGTGRGRSMGDSIYASGLFANRKKKDIPRLSKMLEHAVRLLWARSGAKEDAFNPRISHADAFDFVERHLSLIRFVELVYDLDEGTKRRVSRYVSKGYLSGVFYLMSTLGCECTDYFNSTEPCEALLGELKGEEQADQFFTAIASQDKKVKPMIDAFISLQEVREPTLDERLYILSKAWNLFSQGKLITGKQLTLVYPQPNVVDTYPSFGPLDVI